MVRYCEQSVRLFSLQISLFLAETRLEWLQIPVPIYLLQSGCVATFISAVLCLCLSIWSARAGDNRRWPDYHSNCFQFAVCWYGTEYHLLVYTCTLYLLFWPLLLSDSVSPSYRAEVTQDAKTFAQQDPYILVSVSHSMYKTGPIK